MSAIPENVPASAARHAPRSVPLPPALATGAAVLGAAILTFVMFAPRFAEVWAHGAYYDPDDAMRMVEARALLAGQHWFDMTAYGLNPPDGVYMHWSRTVDAPLALLIEAFRLVSGPGSAERMTRLAYPFLLLLALFYGMARLGTVLLGPAARFPAIVAALFCGGAIVQFQPGRIAHHSPQVLALLFMTIAALEALDPAKARKMAVAGALIGFSLSINLENLPFIACLCAITVLYWVWEGAVAGPALRAFALGLAVSLVLFFAGTVAPDRWFDSVCDAYGAAHAGAGLTGALGCLVLALLSRRLSRRLARLGAAAVTGLCATGFVALAYPACLHDPYAGVAPLVREIWLSNVTEAYPFLRLLHEKPESAWLIILPVLLGGCGSLAAAFAWPGLTGRRFALTAALTLTGLAMGFWQIRVFTSITPVALAGALPLALVAHDRARAAARDGLALIALCLVFPFTSAAWGFVIPDDAAGTKPINTCLAPGAFAPLAGLPAGRVIAPIDSGAYFLVHTGLTVFAAPYHRDNAGNLLMMESFMAKPDAAREMLRARGATYVAICPGFGETQALATRAPDGLAALLLNGQIPGWLTPLAVPGTPFELFRTQWGRDGSQRDPDSGGVP